MAKTFGAESTADEVLEGVDLSGKRVLVTGVSAGLGVETARSVVAHGGTVVGTARDLEKARHALAQAGNPSVDLVEMDLASLASVRKAADDLLARAKPFDVIIANAGVMACPQGKTQDGVATLEKLKAESLKEPSAALYYGVLLSALHKTNQAAPFLAFAKNDVQLLPEEKKLIADAGRPDLSKPTPVKPTPVH